MNNPTINIYNEDCLPAMKEMRDNEFDLSIIDPPYGIKQDKGFSGKNGFRGKGKPIKRRQYNGNWDNKTPNKLYFDELFRISKNQIIFGGNFYTDKIPQANHWIFWDKLNTMPTFGDGELIYTSIKRNSVKKIQLEYNGLFSKEKQRIHPTQKPVAL
ncbi:MAG: site-specific DNA-methyltransferase [Bacteroidales bacterium]|nr:site-specific DNA-methyltransferase [Bacteroidales bacterium]